MGFRVEFNSILRSDSYSELKVGSTYSFSKDGSRIFFDDIPVWLTTSSWLVQAEISIISQTRMNGKLEGEFRVDYLYSGDEQQAISKMFVRMYDGILNPFIYLLSSQAEINHANETGELIRDSLDTEGFIHASPRAQLNRVANKYYKTVGSPLVVVLAVDKISVPVKWEPATGGLYPHIFGPLNMSAVEKIVPIAKNADGNFNISI